MDFLFGWIRTGFQNIWDYFFPTDASRVRHAVQDVTQEVLASDEAQAWLKRSGWSSCENAVAAMRNPATHEAAVFDAIDSFYQCHDNAAKMLERLTCHGLNDGNVTRAYILNSGVGSIGRSESNHQALLLVDEGVSPPKVTLAFRGMNPLTDSLTVSAGMIQAAFGHKAEGLEQQADLFWQGAGPDIQRILAEVAARHPGATPEITVAGHSYGADGAGRTLLKLARTVPKAQLHYIAFGPIQSFTEAERDQVTASCQDAVQYMANSDWVQYVGYGYTIGEKREIPSSAGHVDYGPTGNVVSLMAAVQEMMLRDPKHADALAKQVINGFKHDADATMIQLTTLTGSASTRNGTGLPAQG